MNKNKLRVFFDIYGVSENDLETVYGIPDAREVGIRAHGVIAHDRLFSVISKADFTILLRQPLHCEKAGFSTKAAESMSCAVPVIMTSIGGTDSIIIDNVNGLLLKDNTVNSIVSKLNEIMNYSKQDIVGIKNGASDTADNLFSIEKNRIQIDGFIESIIQKKNRILI